MLPPTLESLQTFKFAEKVMFWPKVLTEERAIKKCVLGFLMVREPWKMPKQLSLSKTSKMKKGQTLQLYVSISHGLQTIKIVEKVRGSPRLLTRQQAKIEAQAFNNLDKFITFVKYRRGERRIMRKCFRISNGS